MYLPDLLVLSPVWKKKNICWKTEICLGLSNCQFLHFCFWMSNLNLLSFQKHPNLRCLNFEPDLSLLTVRLLSPKEHSWFHFKIKRFYDFLLISSFKQKPSFQNYKRYKWEEHLGQILISYVAEYISMNQLFNQRECPYYVHKVKKNSHPSFHKWYYHKNIFYEFRPVCIKQA